MTEMVVMTKRQFMGLLIAGWQVAFCTASLIAFPNVPFGRTWIFWISIPFGVYSFVYNWRRLYWGRA